MATVAGAALIVTNEGGLAPGLRDAATAHLDVAKQDLGLARLIHFIALGLSRRDSAAIGAIHRSPVIRGGSATPFKALAATVFAVFAAGSLMSACGQAALGGHVSARFRRG